ncbi:MAG: aminotransferase class IV [Deltaproteobacteria bacterium]|nr:aminotransferase class IV [Deltaproteobacteria bacterium]
MNTLYQDNAFVDSNDARVSVFDRSFLFGEGLFESFRSYEGQLPFLRHHLDRLGWSSTVLGLTIPDLNFEKICLELLEKNGFEDARFKIVLSRQGKGFGPNIEPEDDTPSLIIFCEELANKEETVSSLKVCRNHINNTAPLATMKTTSYLTKIIAKKEAMEAGFDDAILLDSKGHVTETCSGNLFWIDPSGKLKTPMAEQGCLAGVTQNILKKLLADQKFKIEESVISPNDLSSCKEVFVTNAVQGVMPVGQIDDRNISGGDIGDVTAMIRDLWVKNIKDQLKH